MVTSSPTYAAKVSDRYRQTLKVDAIPAHLAGANFLHQQEVELLKRFRHPRQEPAFLPPF